jgi:hypothetical protein
MSAPPFERRESPGRGYSAAELQRGPGGDKSATRFAYQIRRINNRLERIEHALGLRGESRTSAGTLPAEGVVDGTHFTDR